MISKMKIVKKYIAVTVAEYVLACLTAMQEVSQSSPAFYLC